MKNVLIILLTIQNMTLLAQNKVELKCNENWMKNLIYNDTIYPEDRKQQADCYRSIFDSLDKNQTFSKGEIYCGIGRLVKYLDGGIAEEHGFLAYEIFTLRADDLFTNLNLKAKDNDYYYWAKILYSESRIRFNENIKPHEVIEKFGLTDEQKKQKVFKLIEKQIYIVYAHWLKNK